MTELYASMYLKMLEPCSGCDAQCEQLRSSKTMSTVPSSDTAMEPMQPSRLEKNPNMLPSGA
jgi:hypothetical protein